MKDETKPKKMMIGITLASNTYLVELAGKLQQEQGRRVSKEEVLDDIIQIHKHQNIQA